MIISTNNAVIVSISIDDKLYICQSRHLDFELPTGIHKIQIRISEMSSSDLKKKILRNWLSNLCGAVVYNLNDAYEDAYDKCLSFDMFVDKCDLVIDIDQMLLNKTDDIIVDRSVNIQRINLVNRLYTVPVFLLCCLVDLTFLILGIIAIANSKIGVGIFSMFISVLFIEQLSLV